MKQQINLVNLALLPPKPFFQLQRMMLALLAITAALLATLGLIQPALQEHEAAAASAEARLVAREAQLKAMAQGLEQRQADPRHASDIAQAEQTRQNLQAIAAVLDQPSAQRPAYSPYLLALGQTGISNVWLRAISLDGDQISLEGLSLHASALPEYLQALNQQAAFKGLRFNSFELGHQAATQSSGPAALVFRLESAASGAQP